MQSENKSWEILPVFLKQAIDSEIKRITDIELKEAQERIEKQKSQVIAGVILQVEKMLQVQTMGENLVITIKKV